MYHALTTDLRATQSLLVYPAPESLASNDSFTVKVRMPENEWRRLFCYDVQVDMHNPRSSSMAYFDFTGPIEVSVTYNHGEVRTARIRPLSYDIEPEIDGNTLTFMLTQPCNLSIEVNGDLFGNLHLFAGAIESERPDPEDPNVIYFGPGVHEPGLTLHIPSNRTVYLAGGAVVKSTLVCERVENVRIIGRGVLYQPKRGVEIKFSQNVLIDGITVVNPQHYTVFGGQSRDIAIRNLKSFSSRGWADGIDMMSCSDVLIDGVFLRTSDDAIAIYGHRWDYYGDVKNVKVRNSSLWADVAHAINIGGHGNSETPEVIEDLVFSNIDVLNHDEPQIDYQGSIAIGCADNNIVRDVLVDDVRIENIERGQLLNIRVLYNPKYSSAPGRSIENVSIKNLAYDGEGENISIISGYDEKRTVKNVVFENLKINGQVISDNMPDKPTHWRTSNMAGFHVGNHVEGLVFRADGDSN
ncbi:MAG: hypothetical protein JW829_20175 [Pirellulales bacterium]|nr:hypothetical protein [Pirellulales bacterium]